MSIQMSDFTLLITAMINYFPVIVLSATLCVLFAFRAKTHSPVHPSNGNTPHWSHKRRRSVYFHAREHMEISTRLDLVKFRAAPHPDNPGPKHAVVAEVKPDKSGINIPAASEIIPKPVNIDLADPRSAGFRFSTFSSLGGAKRSAFETTMFWGVGATVYEDDVEDESVLEVDNNTTTLFGQDISPPKSLFPPTSSLPLLPPPGPLPPSSAHRDPQKDLPETVMALTLPDTVSRPSQSQTALEADVIALPALFAAVSLGTNSCRDIPAVPTGIMVSATRVAAPMPSRTRNSQMGSSPVSSSKLIAIPPVGSSSPTLHAVPKAVVPPPMRVAKPILSRTRKQQKASSSVMAIPPVSPPSPPNLPAVLKGAGAHPVRVVSPMPGKTRNKHEAITASPALTAIPPGNLTLQATASQTVRANPSSYDLASLCDRISRLSLSGDVAVITVTSNVAHLAGNDPIAIVVPTIIVTPPVEDSVQMPNTFSKQKTAPLTSSSNHPMATLDEAANLGISGPVAIPSTTSTIPPVPDLSKPTSLTSSYPLLSPGDFLAGPGSVVATSAKIAAPMPSRPKNKHSGLFTAIPPVNSALQTMPSPHVRPCATPVMSVACPKAMTSLLGISPVETVPVDDPMILTEPDTVHITTCSTVVGVVHPCVPAVPENIIPSPVMSTPSIAMILFSPAIQPVFGTNGESSAIPGLRFASPIRAVSPFSVTLQDVSPTDDQMDLSSPDNQNNISASQIAALSALYHMSPGEIPAGNQMIFSFSGAQNDTSTSQDTPQPLSAPMPTLQVSLQEAVSTDDLMALSPPDDGNDSLTPQTAPSATVSPSVSLAALSPAAIPGLALTALSVPDSGNAANLAAVMTPIFSTIPAPLLRPIAPMPKRIRKAVSPTASPSSTTIPTVNSIVSTTCDLNIAPRVPVTFPPLVATPGVASTVRSAPGTNGATALAPAAPVETSRIPAVQAATPPPASQIAVPMTKRVKKVDPPAVASLAAMLYIDPTSPALHELNVGPSAGSITSPPFSPSVVIPGLELITQSAPDDNNAVSPLPTVSVATPSVSAELDSIPAANLRVIAPMPKKFRKAAPPMISFGPTIIPSTIPTFTPATGHSTQSNAPSFMRDVQPSIETPISPFPLPTVAPPTIPTSPLAQHDTQRPSTLAPTHIVHLNKATTDILPGASTVSQHGTAGMPISTAFGSTSAVLNDGGSHGWYIPPAPKIRNRRTAATAATPPSLFLPTPPSSSATDSTPPSVQGSTTTHEAGISPVVHPVVTELVDSMYRTTTETENAILHSEANIADHELQSEQATKDAEAAYLENKRLAESMWSSVDRS